MTASELDQLLREAAASGDCSRLPAYFRAFPEQRRAPPDCLRHAFMAACAEPAALPLLEWLCFDVRGPLFSAGEALGLAEVAGNAAAAAALGDEAALAETLEALRRADYPRADAALSGAPWLRDAVIEAVCAEQLEEGAGGGCPAARWVSERFGTPSPDSPAGELLQLAGQL